MFALAVATVLVWALSGPFFEFSDTWQLVINTGTTIITFLMVFLIQNAQNRDAAAIQVKLDELIRVSRVHNSFVGIEHLTEEELEQIRGRCEQRAKKLIAEAKGKRRATGRSPRSYRIIEAKEIAAAGNLPTPPLLVHEYSVFDKRKTGMRFLTIIGCMPSS